MPSLPALLKGVRIRARWGLGRWHPFSLVNRVWSHAPSLPDLSLRLVMQPSQLQRCNQRTIDRCVSPRQSRLGDLSEERLVGRERVIGTSRRYKCLDTRPRKLIPQDRQSGDWKCAVARERVLPNGGFSGELMETKAPIRRLVFPGNARCSTANSPASRPGRPSPDSCGYIRWRAGDVSGRG